MHSRLQIELGALSISARVQGGEYSSAMTESSGSNSVSPRDAPADERKNSGLGLPQATGLVLATIIGVGVFSLPGSLVPLGPISLVDLGLTTVGAVCLALMLSTRMPADGGPYA